MTADFHMLDTDMSSYILKRRHSTVIKRFEIVEPGNIGISVVTRAELLFGLESLDRVHPLHVKVRGFLRGIQALPWEEGAADIFPGIKHRLNSAGLAIGPMDMMIAAHALALDAVLVTSNTRHFERIPDLRLENWTLPRD